MTPLLVALSFLATPALAGEAGHFDRDAVVHASARFRAVSKSSTGALDPRERALTRTDRTLADLDLSLALSRGAIDAAQHDLWAARLDERSTLFGQEFQALQEQVDGMGQAFEAAFGAALDRARTTLAAAGAAPTDCPQEKGLIAGLAQPGGAAAKTSSCPGPDRSTEIAGLWDRDPQLEADLAAIDASSFQEVTTYQGAEGVVPLGAGAGPAWIDPSSLVERLPEAVELLDAVAERSDDARRALRVERAATPQDAPDAKDRRTAIVLRARAVRRWGEDARAEAGVTLWAALERARKKGKKGGWSGAALCLNPPAWGGCEGEDVTEAVAEALLGDKRLARDLKKRLDGLGQPEATR